MNEIALQKIVVDLQKRVGLLEDVAEAQNDLLCGIVAALSVIGKRTVNAFGSDAFDLCMFGPQNRLRPLPAGITHEDLGRGERAAAFEKEEKEDERFARLCLQNAVLDLRSRRAARAAAKEARDEKLSKLGAHSRGLQLPRRAGTPAGGPGL